MNRPKPKITPAEWGLLLLLAAVHFTNVLDFVIIMPLAPMAKADFGIDAAQFGHVVAVYGFASFLGSILAAKYLDRFGRKSCLLTLYLGFAVSTLLCGLAPDYWSLLAARSVTGLFGGVVGACTMAIVGDVFADHRRGTAMGAVMSSFAVASIVGLPLGLILAERFGFGAPFIALAGLAGLVWLGNWLVMPPLREHLAREHPHASLRQLLAEPRHLLAFAFSITLVLGSFTVIPFLADSMIANAGQRFENLKTIYLIAGVFTLVSTNVVGRLSDRFGKKPVFRVLALMAISMALLLTNLPPVPLWVAIVACTGFMISTSGRMVPAQAMLTGCALPSQRGGFLSLNGAVQAAAMGLASLLGSALIDQREDGRLAGYPIVGAVAAGCALASLVMAGFLRSAETRPETIPAMPEPALAD